MNSHCNVWGESPAVFCSCRQKALAASTGLQVTFGSGALVMLRVNFALVRSDERNSDDVIIVLPHVMNSSGHICSHCAGTVSHVAGGRPNDLLRSWPYNNRLHSSPWATI